MSNQMSPVVGPGSRPEAALGLVGQELAAVLARPAVVELERGLVAEALERLGADARRRCPRPGRRRRAPSSVAMPAAISVST